MQKWKAEMCILVIGGKGQACNSSTVDQMFQVCGTICVLLPQKSVSGMMKTAQVVINAGEMLFVHRIYPESSLETTQ